MLLSNIEIFDSSLTQTAEMRFRIDPFTFITTMEATHSQLHLGLEKLQLLLFTFLPSSNHLTCVVYTILM